MNTIEDKHQALLEFKRNLTERLEAYNAQLRAELERRKEELDKQNKSECNE